MKMARTTMYAALAATAALAMGCTEKPAGPRDPLVAQLVSLGFRRDMIVDRGD
jgi:hypothetical protein